MGLAESMIENGIEKGHLRFGKSMCLVGHAAYVFLNENGLYPTGVWNEVYDDDGNLVGEEGEWHIELLPWEETTILDASTEDVWDSIPLHTRQVIHQVIMEEYPEYADEYVWSFNDDSTITEDDILRVGKMVDERLNL